MKHLNNELLNKYLDNELNDEESKFVTKKLAKFEIDKTNYILLKRIDDGLKRMTPQKISQYFTTNFMEKLRVRTLRQKKQKRFIIYIFSFLVTALIVFSGIAFFEIIRKYLENTNESSILNNFSLNTSFLTTWIENAFAFDNYSNLWIGSSFVMFILLFFLIDEIKKSIQLLSSIR